MESWKYVEGYEYLYQVSNTGFVKSIARYGTKGKIMIPLDNGKGYLRIKLSKNNFAKRVMLHRIIAKAFIPNPENKPYINHIDGNKKNNSIENLEWCTQKENVSHAWVNGLNENVRKSSMITGSKTIHNIKYHNCKKVILLSENKIFNSQTELSEYLKCYRKKIPLLIKKGIVDYINI